MNFKMIEQILQFLQNLQKSYKKVFILFTICDKIDLLSVTIKLKEDISIYIQKDKII